MSVLCVRAAAGATRGWLTWPGGACRCALGRGGIAVRKREGDGVTPAGRFVLETVYYRADRGPRPPGDLPATAIKYIRRIEELIEAPVTLLSTSPERDDTIMVRDPFAD